MPTSGTTTSSASSSSNLTRRVDDVNLLGRLRCRRLRMTRRLDQVRTSDSGGIIGRRVLDTTWLRWLRWLLRNLLLLLLLLLGRLNLLAQIGRHVGGRGRRFANDIDRGRSRRRDLVLDRGLDSCNQTLMGGSPTNPRRGLPELNLFRTSTLHRRGLVFILFYDHTHALHTILSVIF